MIPTKQEWLDGEVARLSALIRKDLETGNKEPHPGLFLKSIKKNLAKDVEDALRKHLEKQGWILIGGLNDGDFIGYWIQ